MSKVKLREIGAFKNGLNFSADCISEGCKMIGIPDFGSRYFADFSNLSEVDTAIVPDECTLKDGDILFVRSNGNKALVGRTMIISGISEKITFSGFCIRFRPISEIVIPLYLLLLFKSPFFRKRFSNTQQTSINNINQDVLGEIEIDLPSKDEQQKIIDCIYPIIRKIDVNNTVNDNLEQMLLTKYEYIFVQNKKADWKSSTLGQLVEMYQPKTISGSDMKSNGAYFVYGANGIIGKYNQYNHVEPQIAVACRGASCGALTMTLPNVWITGNAMVVNPLSSFPYKEYLYYTLCKKNISYLCSGSAQPQLTRENMSLYNLLIPSEDVLKHFEQEANAARKIIISNQLENNRLADLRDWLLPMLMNGQATIED